MDAISYSYADKQAKRIKKFIENPDSTSGVLTVPKVIAAGETITIPAGRMAILPNVQVDGTLDIQGEVFIPSGATTTGVVEKVASTDNAIVRFNGTTGDVQNSGVIIDDNNNIKVNGNTPASGKLSIVGDNGGISLALSDNVNGSLYVKHQNPVTFGTDAGGSIAFATNGFTERMRIDASGNVGIGVTPSAWGSGGWLEFSNSAGLTAKGTLNIGANWYFNNNFKYSTTMGASLYTQEGGQHNWYTALSGTAGSTIPWTNAMTLDSSGNLNVGVSGASYNAFYKNGGGTAGTGIIFMIANAGSDSVVNVMNATSMGMSNSAGTAIRVAISGTTNRSINAAGTINASGADYAEYEYSNDINLVKGQIVGFKADGTLTDKYSESIRFAIKSTNPSIVGGDVWGCENIVGIRPEKPVRKLDTTEQKLIKDAVLGDDGTILEDAVYETVIIEKGDSDKEWELIYSTYEKDLADFENRLEAERQKVDRIAYAGKVPVNVYGAVAGQYIIAIEKEDGTIDGKLVNKADMTFSEYQDAVGRVNKILDDGRAEVAVIIH